MSNTQNATPTQEMIDAENARHDEMAAACAIDSDNYAKFVANLTRPAGDLQPLQSGDQRP